MKFGKRVRSLLVIVAITIIVYLPTTVYLGTITAAAHVAPLYCNAAGGCPWR